MNIITIVNPGLLTTVQDRGRSGWQRYGMPVSGAMDLYSLMLANMLVGNDPGEAALEATLTGPEMVFGTDTAVAITGADMGPYINNLPVRLNTTLFVSAGDTLSFTGLKNGARCYIGFSGGIDVPVIMGSRSTYLMGMTGGFMGRALKEGDILQIGRPERRITARKVPESLLPLYSSTQTLRIIPGPEAGMFGMEGLRTFLTTGYQVSTSSDRMGYRLSGSPIGHQNSKADIISSGVAAGTVQVPGDGQPLLLMADRQTTGGYPRIAVVISADMTLAAQLKPGDVIRFSESRIDEAQDILRSRLELMEEYF